MFCVTVTVIVMKVVQKQVSASATTPLGCLKTVLNVFMVTGALNTAKILASPTLLLPVTTTVLVIGELVNVVVILDSVVLVVPLPAPLPFLARCALVMVLATVLDSASVIVMLQKDIGMDSVANTAMNDIGEQLVSTLVANGPLKVVLFVTAKELAIAQTVTVTVPTITVVNCVKLNTILMVCVVLVLNQPSMVLTVIKLVSVKTAVVRMVELVMVLVLAMRVGLAPTAT